MLATAQANAANGNNTTWFNQEDGSDSSPNKQSGSASTANAGILNAGNGSAANDADSGYALGGLNNQDSVSDEESTDDGQASFYRIREFVAMSVGETGTGQNKHRRSSDLHPQAQHPSRRWQ
jgi:hypothetical protein